MNRRDAIRHSSLLALAAMLGVTLPVRTWAALPATEGWSTDDEDLLTLIGDTILPATPDSPGAGAVGIGRFITTMARFCQPPEAEAGVRQVLRELQKQSREHFPGGFAGLGTADRESVLSSFEATAGSRSPNSFRQIKELTLLGYFTSEVGATQALRYDPVPGAYRGSVRISDGDRSWAT